MLKNQIVPILTSEWETWMSDGRNYGNLLTLTPQTVENGLH